MPEQPPDFTQLLRDYEADVSGAADRLAEAVYADLQRMARKRLTERYGENLAGLTIQPTVLASDTLLRMLRQVKTPANRRHFFALAVREMFRVLRDYERKRDNGRPRGEATLVNIDSQMEIRDKRGLGPLDLVELHAALDRLREKDPLVAEVFEARRILGMTIDETADALGISHATVERKDEFARAWLATQLGSSRETRA